MSAPTSFLRAVLTLLTGSALAQLVPLLLGPLLTRLFTPEAFGAFTAFTTIAATMAVVACARYEFALPMAKQDGEARILLLLCLRILAVVTLVSVPLTWLLAQLGYLPTPWLLPLAVVSSGALQLLIMWSNRANRFRALAISRVVQYAGAAVLQVVAGAVLWWQFKQPAGADWAWVLMAAPIVAVLIATLPLYQPAPGGGWRSMVTPLSNADKTSLVSTAKKYKDFPLLNTPHAFLGTLQDAVTVALLIAITGQASAGFWGLALRYLKAPATLVGGAVSQAMYPRLTGAQPDQARHVVRQAMLILGGLALALMLVLMLVGPWLFVVLFGPQWQDAGELARALSPYIAVHFVAAPMAYVTMAWHAQRWAFKIAVVGQVVFVSTLCAGLYWGGLIAGAWAVSAGMVLYFGWYFYKLAFWPNIPPADSTS